MTSSHQKTAASARTQDIRITKVEPFLLHVPINDSHIADSTHKITHWGLCGVMIHTNTGLCGFGYTGTHAHRECDLLILNCITRVYAPLLLGESIHDVHKLWKKLYHFPPAQWVGRSGITQLALAAVDVALWDLKAKACELPLWQLLGGSKPDGIKAYNTNVGWLSLSKQQLVDECCRAVQEDGFQAVKMKVGKPKLSEDLERLAAVRKAIGPQIQLMVDANGCYDLPTAIMAGRHFEDYDVAWFEEPLWYDDIEGHQRLAQAISVPIALGEQLYSLDAFKAFVSAKAVHYVQPDATRLGGISEWWQVADLSRAHRLPVAPHVGDMMQIHLQVALAHMDCVILEYIPWTLECFVEPAISKGGWFLPPQLPGAGTELRGDAIKRFGVSLQ